jgi:amino acid adenylation domain-containing protein
MLSGFLKYANETPASPAIYIEGKIYSYAECYKMAAGVAKKIKTASGNYIGLYTDNTIYTYTSLLGILLSGKAFVPLNHKFPDPRLLAIIRDAGIQTVLGSEESKIRIDAINAGMNFIFPEKESPAESFPFEKPSGDTDAYILYTSGSTGVPKGIPITIASFEALMTALRKRFTLQQKDKVLQAFELSFDVSLACIFLTFEYGSALVVADLNGITAVNAFKAIYENQVSFVTLPPSALFYLKRLRLVGSVPLPFVHTTLFTGEALPFSVVEEWRKCAPSTVVENAYGPTETTVWCLFYRLDETTKDQLVNGLCPIGEGLDGIGVEIVDESGKKVADEVRGELWVSGEQIFRGYRNNPAKTKEVLAVNEKNERVYKTGDIVVKNSRGNIVYVNRKDNQVQVNGYRVELGEVEHALRKASGIESAVIIASEKNQVTELYGFLEGNFNKEEIFSLMRAQLPGYMVPRELFGVKALPLNTNGKIDKLRLREEFLK